MRIQRITTNADIFYPDLSYKIVGILFVVHNELGRFAREKQYADYVESLLKEANIFYKRELSISTTGNILDFLIEEKIVLELKAVKILTRAHYRQIQNYLQYTQLKLGLLVNFRQFYLKPKRIIRIDS
ncbi:MAG: GxxExxY protein [Patescibacteria group bacterium]|nr:GxxExxY protein [Patescibacteria group bacterium]